MSYEKSDTKKCIECGKSEELETITLCDDNGFCQSTKHEPLCWKCYGDNSQMTKAGHFIKLKSGLYHDRGFNRIRTEGQLKYIFNQDFYDLLECIK